MTKKPEKKHKKNVKIKKAVTIYFFFLGILTSVMTQIIHCVLFYHCRTIFLHIIEGNTSNIFLDIQKYILMFFCLYIYGFMINHLHRIVLDRFIKKQKIALLLEDILLGWKYFVLLLVLLYKMFLIAHWALAVYLWIVNVLILYKKRILTIIVFTLLFVMHVVLYYSFHGYFNSLFMATYSSIYLAISPCLHTIQRLQTLLKMKS